VTVRTRVSTLEKKARKVGKSRRCRICKERPGAVVRVYRREKLGADRRLVDLGGDQGEACARCGWAPAIIEGEEIVVRTRDELRAVEAEAEARGLQIIRAP
jgi:hypothetical protein